jgi:hypothetical protein
MWAYDGDNFPDCEYYNESIKPYSTDITAAMELLPDPLMAGYCVTIQRTIKRDAISVSMVLNTQIKWVAEGQDLNKLLSGAISGAWLKWKDPLTRSR